MLIRDATSSDAELLRALATRTFVETFAASNTEANMRDYLESAFAPDVVLRELQDPTSMTLILEVDDVAAGYARLQLSNAPGAVLASSPIELVRLYVDAPHHGSGAGAHLMEACLNEARQLGRDVMWLGVWAHNPRAISFYGKWNFVRVGEHTFRLGDEQQIDWLMSRRI